MKGTHLSLVVIGAVLAATWAMPAATQTQDTTPSAKPAPAAPAGDAAKGKELFRKTACYQCHSEQAQGGAQGPRIGPNPIPFAAFSRYLRAPKGEMPPYTIKVMSDQDVADIHAFLRGLPPPPPLSSLPLLQP